MRYLAIDWGQKRTGLAVGDDETGIATPLEVIATSSPQEHWRRLIMAVQEHQPEALVIGLPLDKNGREGSMAKQIRAWSQEVKHRFRLPVHLVDERLTSYEANDRLGQSGLTHQGKKRRRDAVAAMGILQDFLAGTTS